VEVNSTEAVEQNHHDYSVEESGASHGEYVVGEAGSSSEGLDGEYGVGQIGEGSGVEQENEESDEAHHSRGNEETGDSYDDHASETDQIFREMEDSHDVNTADGVEDSHRTGTLRRSQTTMNRTTAASKSTALDRRMTATLKGKTVTTPLLPRRTKATVLKMLKVTTQTTRPRRLRPFKTADQQLVQVHLPFCAS
jgi:hypothetical protein